MLHSVLEHLAKHTDIQDGDGHVNLPHKLKVSDQNTVTGTARLWHWHWLCTIACELEVTIVW